ncbi:MAG: hypothetical protein LIP77_09195 [Planctomycetes bacterium]|nr:hypothetical protein [Planctomycetota bacterium]
MVSPPRGIVPATPGLADDLARHLSPDHLREVAETAGLTPRAALRLSLDASLEAYALLDDDGGVRFMLGVETPGLLTGGALVWMLAAASAARRPAALVRAATWGLDRAFAVTGAWWVEQFIPEWYVTGLRFARRLGFRLEPGYRAGTGAIPVRRVVLYRQDRR